MVQGIPLFVNLNDPLSCMVGRDRCVYLKVTQFIVPREILPNLLEGTHSLQVLKSAIAIDQQCRPSLQESNVDVWLTNVSM